MAFNIFRKKNQRLLEYLGRVDRRHAYYLYIISCYFTMDGASNLLNRLYKHFNLKGVKIYIDKKSALKIGKEILQQWQDGYEDLTLYTVSHTGLFHSKAYALVRYEDDEDSEIAGGSLVVGSANLTGNGITSLNGNIECLLSTQELSEISDFVASLDRLKCNKLDLLEEFTDCDDVYFQFAFLNEGEFAHKWTDNFKSYLSVKFELNEEGIARTKVDQFFTDMGFYMESQSISKFYLNFDVEKYQSEELKNFIRNYGIENHLGYWVPRGMFDEIIKSSAGFDLFKDEIHLYFEENLDAVLEAVKSDYQTMLSSGLINEPTVPPQDALKSKFEELLDNEDKLSRIFSKLAIFDLPYDISSSEQISGLFDEITAIAKSKKKRNIGTKAWVTGVDAISLQVLRGQSPHY